MNYQFVSINRIFANLSRFIEVNQLSEIDIINWTGQALDALDINGAYKPKVSVKTVINHQCDLPPFTKSIIQLARNNDWNGVPEDFEKDTSDVTIIDANGDPYDKGIIYADLFKKYKYTPIRLADNSFFNVMVCKENDYEDIYKSCIDEYTIIDNVLRFSFSSGQVLISTLSHPLDDNGYPMIPDDISITTAIEKYIKMKVFEEQFENGDEGSERRYSKFESDWHWYCKQSKNKDKMPKTVDDWQDILEQRVRLVHNYRKYYGFFGSLNSSQKILK